MFETDDFEQYSNLYPIVKKLEKNLLKGNESKVLKQINVLEKLLKEERDLVPITYILSIIAERYPKFITNSLIKDLIPLLEKKEEKIRINVILILGFHILHDQKHLKENFSILLKHLEDPSEDVRINVHYFLTEILDKTEELELLQEDLLINSLLMEKNEENTKSLLTYLSRLPRLKFENLLKLRNLLIGLISRQAKDIVSPLSLLILTLINKFYRTRKNLNFENMTKEDLINYLKNHFIMTRLEFGTKRGDNGNFKDFLAQFKAHVKKDDLIFLYFLDKEKKKTIFLQFEKKKLLNYFSREKKFSRKELMKTFHVLLTKRELSNFIKTLTKLGFIIGYLSELGNFYSQAFIRKKVEQAFSNKGYLDLNEFNYLPGSFLLKTFREIIHDKKDFILVGKGEKRYYSLEKIKEQINLMAPKVSSIDLKEYREKLQDHSFIKLIKNLPRDYITSHHKGTTWLTNLGKIRIEKEIENSKILGFFEIPRISKKLEINPLLLLEIFELYIDKRSGLYDINKEIFYYSKYINQKIQEIKLSSERGMINEKIRQLAKELNIGIEDLEVKINENLQLIGQELQSKGQISIKEYLEKTGMEESKFLTFLEDFDINYLLKGDLLIMNQRKIKEAEKELKNEIIEKCRSENYLALNQFEVSPNLVKKLIEDLIREQEIKGLFYQSEDEELFYTEKGIKKLILENSFLFSFHDLFYNKELSEEEIQILQEIFNDLRKKKILKGNFDEDTLTFSSNEVLFARDYNSYIYQFQKLINDYMNKFNDEFSVVKAILTKRNQTIFPQEIKQIQEIIDRMNENIVRWRSTIDSFLMKASRELLIAQGVRPKKYRSFLSFDENEDIKYFKDEPEVVEYLENFKEWVKIFNELEIKYPNIIYYQKRMIHDKNNEGLKEKYESLLEELCMK